MNQEYDLWWAELPEWAKTIYLKHRDVPMNPGEASVLADAKLIHPPGLKPLYQLPEDLQAFVRAKAAERHLH